MKTNKKIMLAAMMLMMAGCSTQDKPVSNNVMDTGKLTLSINPEIEIEYNKKGIVTEVSGLNEDGKNILKTDDDYIGEECEEVVNELIEEIYDAGYFIDKVDGKYRNIVIQLEPGSVLPEEEFLENVSSSVRTQVKRLKSKNDVVSIDEDDYDDKYDKTDKPSHFITLEKAQEIALLHLDLDRNKVVFTEREYDLEDGRPIYELDFKANGYEYDVEVDAKTGKVINVDVDHDDDIYDDDIYDDDDNRTSVSSSLITAEKAKQIALNHFSLNGSNVYFEKVELDEDDGIYVYEIEMKSGNKEYEIEIHAVSGQVLDSEVDYDD